jgi:hypothetical protein
MRTAPVKFAALAAGLLAVACGAAVAQESQVQAILKAHEAARPTDKELEWFSLDWAETLQAAMERAARERRPILFLHTNGRGNLYCGFC